MRIVMVYREASEHRMAVESFIRDFEIQTGGKIEVINPDTREGNAFCNVYDVVEFPTMLALTVDGSPVAVWRGTSFPTISEASDYN